jgi:hypothetical protein
MHWTWQLAIIMIIWTWSFYIQCGYLQCSGRFFFRPWTWLFSINPLDVVTFNQLDEVIFNPLDVGIFNALDVGINAQDVVICYPVDVVQCGYL